MMGRIVRWTGAFCAALMLTGWVLFGISTATVGQSAELVTETRQCRGTITENTVSYTVVYPAGRTHRPVFFHQYGQTALRTGVQDVNERVAGYGILSVFVSLTDSHCGYALQDYKDAIDDIFRRYADKVDAGNVTIAGESYGGAVVYGMATRFPYLFDAVIPIFGVSDFGYDATQSWYPMVSKNSPTWGVLDNLNRKIGDHAAYRETRYLVRNAVFAAKNNPYAHFEILHDADDGVGKPGVQVELSRRYVAELRRLGYENFCYTETPKAGFVDRGGQPIRYSHGFWNPNHASLAEFERNTLKPHILSGTWKRPPFAKTGDLFIPSFLEVPCFRFDLGRVENNCDEAADVHYDVSSPERFRFRIIPRTALTTGKLRLFQLVPGDSYNVTWSVASTCGILEQSHRETDAAGSLGFQIPGVAKGSTLIVECVRAAKAKGDER